MLSKRGRSIAPVATMPTVPSGVSIPAAENGLAKGLAQPVQHGDLAKLLPQMRTVGNTGNVDWSERIAHGGNAACSCCAQQRTQHSRHYMRVLVSIQVRYNNTRRLQLADLRRGFGFDIVHIDSAPHHAQGETVKTVVKAAIVEFSIRQSRGSRFSLQHG